MEKKTPNKLSYDIVLCEKETCSLITDNPIQSALIFILSELTYVPNLSSPSVLFRFLSKQTFRLASVTWECLYLPLLCINSNLKNKWHSPEMLEAHLQPITRRKIMRLLKNRKTKKKGKVSLRGDSSQAVEAGACIYNGAAFTVQGGVPCWWPSIETEGVVWHFRPFTQTPGFECRVILTTLPVCN